MSDDIILKLNDLERKLDTYKEGEALPISIKDIYFILGACEGLHRNFKETEIAYVKDTKRLMDDVDKFRNLWKESRKLCVKQDNKVMRYKAVIDAAKNLSFWRKTKRLKTEIALTEKFENKNK